MKLHMAEDSPLADSSPHTNSRMDMLYIHDGQVT